MPRQRQFTALAVNNVRMSPRKWAVTTMITLAMVVFVTTLIIAGCSSGSKSNAVSTTVNPSTFTQDMTKASYVGMGVKFNSDGSLSFSPTNSAGTKTCYACHSSIVNEFTGSLNGPTAAAVNSNFSAAGTSGTNHHGLNFHAGGPRGELLNAHAGGCLPCHTTGWSANWAPTNNGYNSANPQPAGLSSILAAYDGTVFSSTSTRSNLEGIQCEECHGPGSLHVAGNGNISQITLVPPYKATCENCHLNAFGALNPNNPQNDTTAAAVVTPAVLTAQNLTLNATDASGNSLPGAPASHTDAIMLEGYLGYNIAHMPSPHSTLPKGCLECHFSTPNVSPTTGFQNHSQSALLPPNVDRTRPECISCHSQQSKDSFSTPLQSGIEQSLIALGGASASGAANSKPTGGLIQQYYVNNGVATALSTSTVALNYKIARYNYCYCVNDASLGVHNPGFVQQMLNDANAAIGNGN